MYFLVIHKKDKNFLYSIRHWDNLKISISDDRIFVKDFDAEQMKSPILKQIPNATFLILKNNLLFKIDKLLPFDKLPSGLLWSPIDKFLMVELPKFNHNYFGISEKIELKLIPSFEEKNTFALLTSLEQLSVYIMSAPKIRLKNIKWVIINDHALLIGGPILPILGKTFWFQKNLIIPNGYDFEFSILTDTISQKCNPFNDSLILFNIDSSYTKILKTDFKPLSIASYKTTVS